LLGCQRADQRQQRWVLEKIGNLPRPFGSNTGHRPPCFGGQLLNLMPTSQRHRLLRGQRRA